MREILFRGRTIDNRWKKGYLITEDEQNESGKWEKVYKIHDGESFKYEVNPETIGQYTGLRDKNGKKIFEGDILAFTTYDGRILIEGVVRYGKFNYFNYNGAKTSYGWFIDDGEMSYLDGSNPELHIIGNIHDNPELLEGDDE